MPRPASLTLAGALLACLAMVLAASAARGQSSPEGPCRTSACQVKLKVGTDETKWRSIETFYPNNETLSSTLTAKGRQLRLVETWGPGDCRGAYNGAGIVAVVKACGDATPLRVRAYRRVKQKRISLVVGYQATPVAGDDPG